MTPNPETEPTQTPPPAHVTDPDEARYYRDDLRSVLRMTATELEHSALEWAAMGETDSPHAAPKVAVRARTAAAVRFEAARLVRETLERLKTADEDARFERDRRTVEIESDPTDVDSRPYAPEPLLDALDRAFPEAHGARSSAGPEKEA